MEVVSVTVAQPRVLTISGKEVSTGIFKEAVSGRVQVRRLNVEGDAQGDLRVHGGENMAVYAYPVEHYPFWENELGRADLPHGQFGENFTVRGLTEERARVGEVYRIGGALLQVTQPRIPCFKLVYRMDAGPEFAKPFPRKPPHGLLLSRARRRRGRGRECHRVDRGRRGIRHHRRVHRVHPVSDAQPGRAAARTGVARPLHRIQGLA